MRATRRVRPAVALLLLGAAAAPSPDPVEAGGDLAPTVVPGDLAGRPPAEVVDALGRATGFPLRFVPLGRDAPGRDDPPPAVAGNTTFWEAVDRLSRDARLEVAPRLAIEGRRIELEPVAARPAPATVRGAFRLSVVGLDQAGTVTYGAAMDESAVADEEAPAAAAGANPGVPTPRRSLAARMLLLAEPRRLIDVQLAGPPRVDEAVDDRGRSLAVAPPKFDYPDHYGRDRLLIGLNLRVPLAALDPPGRSIRRLRGGIPVVAWVEHPETLEVDLREPAGRPLRGSGVVLKVLAAPPNRATRVVRLEIGPGEADPPRPPALALYEAGPDRLFLDHSQQFEVLDAAGARIEVAVATARAPAPNTWTVTLTPSARSAQAVPARVRYHGLAWSRGDVPFDFAELPLP